MQPDDVFIGRYLFNFRSVGLSSVCKAPAIQQYQNEIINKIQQILNRYKLIIFNLKKKKNIS